MSRAVVWRIVARLVMAAAGVASFPVAASDWFFVEQSDTGRHFIDRSSLVLKGAVADVWTLSDLRGEVVAKHGYPFRSIKQRIHFSCKDRTALTLYTVAYSGNYGAGEVMEMHEDAPKYLQIPPDSVFDAVLKVVCPGNKKSGETRGYL